MDFFNDTSLDCHLARAQLFFKDLLQAVVVVKGSFDVLPSGRGVEAFIDGKLVPPLP